MTGNAINAKSEVLDVRELSSDELDAVSGGIIAVLIGLSSDHDIVTATTPPNGHVK
jgi:hypothetical protein